MKKKDTLILLVGLFAFIMVAGGISYGYFVYNKDVATVDLTSGEISINFSSSNSVLSLSNIMTMSDEQGMITSNYLDFTVTGKVDIEPIIYELEVVSNNLSLNNYIRVYLTDQNDSPVLSPFSYSELYDSLANDGKTIYQDLIEGNLDGTSKTITKDFRLRVWLDESYVSTESQSFNVSIYLYARNTDSTNLRLVTFNTQDGRSNGPVKYVTLGEEYGVMPIPTREGYTFLGWNGKNMFPDLIVNHSFNNTTGEFIESSGIAVTDFIPVDFASNSAYKFDLSGNYRTMFGAYNENYEFMGRVGGDKRTSYIMRSNVFTVDTTNAGGTISYIRVRVYEYSGLSGVISDVNNFNYQMEPGTTSTSYEPFIITSSYEVAEKNNFTLKAIWQKNS